MDIKNIEEKDLAALAGLYEQFWNERSSLPQMRKSFQELRNNPDYILLQAKTDGLLVGSAMGIICYELYGGGQSFMVIEDVIVDKQQRREGIGTALISELEKQAADRDCKYIMLVTEAARSDAHAFYASLGYELDNHKGFKKQLKHD